MIRKMVLGDLSDIMIMENQLFSSPWTYDNYVFELTENPYSQYMVLDEQGSKGYLGLWFNDNALQITTLGVDPMYQDKGYGKELLDYALHFATENKISTMTLEVRASNTKALHLYEKAGFHKVAVRKQYYTHPDEDALLMLKHFKQM